MMTTHDSTSPRTGTASLADQTTAVDRLIAAALASVGVCEAGGDNRGPMVERYLHDVGLPPGQPWCAAFVYHVGYWSQYNPATHLSTWPLLKTGGCARLGEHAAACGLVRLAPARGSVFLLYEPKLGRFGHTGIVTGVEESATGFLCTTVEGNTNTDGSREGRACCARTRAFERGNRDRFIDWWEVVR